MAVELRPLGVACNIACQYCYQHPQREVGGKQKPYDLTKMKEAIIKEGGPFALFGGEPLLVPVDDLEELFSWGLEQFGSNAIQTNGTLITDRHIELFKSYKVSVGLSVDGPGKLNDVRWSRSLVNTREQTEKTHQSIRNLVQQGVIPGLIVTLHKGNASIDKLPLMEEWIKELDQLGIRSVRLHLMEVDNDAVGAKYQLSPEENVQAMMFFHQLEKELSQLRFDVFGEITNLLKANDKQTSCVWNACDPFTTRAVRGVEGNGSRSNCGRTNKLGIDFVKSNTPSFIRYVSLYNTPQEAGGCKGCRFFMMCKGHCPGTSIEGDWRNRTEHCEVWKSLFETKEAELVAEGELPLSLHPAREIIEQQMIAHWSEGVNCSIQSILLKLLIATNTTDKNHEKTERP